MVLAILSASFLCLAGICKAIADTLFFHYDNSIFKDKNPKWWNPNVSWQYVGYMHFTSYRPDAWHLANSGMIVFFCAAFCLHQTLTHYWFEPIVSFFLSGLLFNISFNLFFNKILRK